MPGTVYHLNGDFDLSLRSRPLALRRKSTMETVQALSVHWLLAGTGGDALLTPAGIPDGFMEYLRRKGIDPPRPVRIDDVDRAMRYRPFGWNAETAEINGGRIAPRPIPPLRS